MRPRDLVFIAWLFPVALGAATLAAQEPAASLLDRPASMESQPYRVRLLVAGDDALTAPSHQLETALARSVGSLWHTEIGELTGLSRCDGDALNRWTVSDVRDRFSDPEIEFWYAAAIHRRGPRWEVAVRAWQPQFDWLSPVHTETYYEPRETAARIVKLCWSLFRPQILIEHVDENACRVRIRAGDLRPADPDYELLHPGDCLVPWLMYYDRNKALKRKQELPWTYVRLDDVAGPLANGTVLSGLRMPLSGKTRGRIDKVAVAARAVYPESRLQLGVYNQPARTLAGCRLELRPNLPEPKSDADAEGAETADDSETVLTDRLGEATLLPDSDQQHIWVYVYSGDLLLARVPFVPGSLPFLRLEVPDDSLRLQVEGELQLLQSELINSVAERNTLIAAARTASKKGDWKHVEVLRKQLSELPSKKIFFDKLAGIRVPALNAAKSRKDRAAQIRIDRLCKETGELVDRYLNPERVKAVEEELDQLAKDAQIDVK